ncbi:type II toxin-antitoxin system RelE/ParE family toxin [Sphingosinicella soli]|uniref:Toxin n=1 Tax=Sphingosinicella soli TaxID=333708 RepID=A0A7W7F8P8_9SPHN|nr:type II toxin-antitoxin system RelE/ParE family toxin [Sphingosinicella soli]MBB4631883.1 toxin ParE1/3/4 [Sphingosinicella soli]
MADRGGGFRLTPRAEADLEDIFAYTVQRWSFMQAQDYHAGLMAGLERLGSGERSGQPLDIPGAYRKYAVGSHLVIYRIAETDIVVVRILHQRMDVERHLE